MTTEHLSRPTTWGEIKSVIGNREHRTTPITDAEGNAWGAAQGKQRVVLGRHTAGGGVTGWWPENDDIADVPQPPIPEPPDGSRIEFVYNTDVYAAWRDDASSRRAGWVDGDGGQVWVVYPGTVPECWKVMWLMFGEALRDAVLLAPVGRVAGEQCCSVYPECREERFVRDEMASVLAEEPVGKWVTGCPHASNDRIIWQETAR